jgi:hypothetical protein
MTPNRTIASRVYDEQVGWYLQLAPRLGLTSFW